MPALLPLSLSRIIHAESFMPLWCVIGGAVWEISAEKGQALEAVAEKSPLCVQTDGECGPWRGTQGYLNPRVGGAAEHRQFLVLGVFLTVGSHHGQIHGHPFLQGLSTAELCPFPGVPWQSIVFTALALPCAMTLGS